MFLRLLVALFPSLFDKPNVSVTPYLPVPSRHRAKIPQTKEEIDQQRGQETTDGLHRRAAAKTKNGVSDKSVFDGAEAAELSAGAGPERIPNQDLVSEQKGQNQESQRHQEHSGPAPDGTGTVQSRHRHVEGRKIRQRLIWKQHAS